MSLEPQEQFKKFIDSAQDVLIIIPENPSGDAIGSAWALSFFLEKKNILSSIVFSGQLQPKFSFLPNPENILPEISGARDFVLSFDTSRNKIVGLRSEEKDGKFNIFLTPKKGAIDPRDFSFVLAKFKFDLLIVLDSPDLEKLGKTYTNNPDLFFEVPIINIDHRSDNENFGQINLVDITASSCSEILSRTLAETDLNLLDQKIAECLLAGIISSTDSFQKRNTTPKALLAAATLMDRGADQQKIIRWLYKTQPLNTLKLWGRAMAKLNWNEESKIIWSEISVEDFVQSRSTPADIRSILEKLQENYSEGKIFVAVYNDTPSSSIALIKTSHLELLQQINSVLNGSLSGDYLEIKISTGSLSEAAAALIKKIKEIKN